MTGQSGNTRRVYSAEADLDGDEEVEEVASAMKASTIPGSSNRTSNQRRDDRERSYVYPPADHVVSTRKPPGECYICGSKMHFQRECPHYAVYSRRAERGQVDAKKAFSLSAEYEAAEAAYLDERADDDTRSGF